MSRITILILIVMSISLQGCDDSRKPEILRCWQNIGDVERCCFVNKVSLEDCQKMFPSKTMDPGKYQNDPDK